MSTEYIHVNTATKAPVIRTGGSPFEFHNSDPNLSSAFGPDQATMFLAVVRGTTPVVSNPVLERIFTPQTDGYDGVYADPNWAITPIIVDQILSDSKDFQLNELSVAYSNALSGGYAVGPFVFPFDEEFFRLLQTRAAWMKSAVEDAEIPPNTEMTFSDRAGKEVSRTETQLRGDVHAYGIEFFSIQEKEIAARGEIEAATTIQGVDAVTWAF